MGGYAVVHPVLFVSKAASRWARLCEFACRGRASRVEGQRLIPCAGFFRKPDIVSKPRWVALLRYKFSSSDDGMPHSRDPERSGVGYEGWLSQPDLTNRDHLTVLSAR